MKKFLFILSLVVCTVLALMLPLVCFAFSDRQQLNGSKTVRLEKTDYSDLLVSPATPQIIQEMLNKNELHLVEENDFSKQKEYLQNWVSARMQAHSENEPFISRVLKEAKHYVDSLEDNYDDTFTWVKASGVSVQNKTIYSANVVAFAIDDQGYSLRVIASEDAQDIFEFDLFFETKTDDSLLDKYVTIGLEEFMTMPSLSQKEQYEEGEWEPSVYDICAELRQYGYSDVYLPNDSMLSFSADEWFFRMFWTYS